MKYVVYLISYRGSKLPPFYIGSTSSFRIQGGYRGSVNSKEYKSTWKTEWKANPHLFKIHIVGYRETREEAYALENHLIAKVGAVLSPLYLNKTSSFGFGYHPTGEDSPRYRVPHTVEAKRKMSIVHRGKKLSVEHKAMISDRHKNQPKSNETRAKMSEAAKGRVFTDEAKDKMSKSHLGKKASESTRQKQRERALGRKWWTDGVASTLSAECPGATWKPGRK